MPYSSDAQRRWAHTDSAKKAGFPTEEFDKASKGKKLPKKMNNGGEVEFEDPVPGPAQGTNIHKDSTGYKHLEPYDTAANGGIIDNVQDTVREYIQNLMGQGPLAADKNEAAQAENVDPVISSTEAYHNNVGNGLESPSSAIRGAQGGIIEGYSEGGAVTFPHREKSGPSLTQAPKKFDEGTFDVANDDTTANTQGLPSINKYSPIQANDPGLQTVAPLKFNPQSGMPPAPPPPPVVPPIAPIQLGAGIPIPGGQNDAIANYLNQQRAAISKYGPEQQLAVTNDVLNRQNGLQGRLSNAGAGLGDAIMGAFGKQSPGFQRNLQERQQAQGQMQIGGMENAGKQQIAQVEAKMKLDAMDPNSGISKAAQKSYSPILKQYGWSDSTISSLSAQDMQQVSSLMQQFVGKNLELHMKQLELQLKAQEQAETHRANVSKENIQGEEVQGKAAENIVKPPTSLLERILGPNTSQQRTGAERVLAKQAGIQPAGVPPGRITVTSPDGKIGHIPQSQLKDALAQGYTQS